MAIKAHRHRSTSTLQIDRRSPHGHSLLQIYKRSPHGHKGASPQVNKHLSNRQAKPTWPFISAWLKTNVIVALLLSLCIHTYIYMCIYIYNYIHIYIYIYICRYILYIYNAIVVVTMSTTVHCPMCPACPQCLTVFTAQRITADRAKFNSRQSAAD